MSNFGAAFARYDAELESQERYEIAFEAYCVEYGRDSEDPDSVLWFDAHVRAHDADFDSF
jgi:hypothetical protein